MSGTIRERCRNTYRSVNLAVRNLRSGAEVGESGVRSGEGKWGYTENNEDCRNDVIIVSRLLEESGLFFVFKGRTFPSC